MLPVPKAKDGGQDDEEDRPHHHRARECARGHGVVRFLRDTSRARVDKHIGTRRTGQQLLDRPPATADDEPAGGRGERGPPEV